MVSALAHLAVIGALLVVQALRWVPLGAPPQEAVVELVLDDPGAGGAPRVRGEGEKPQTPPHPAAPAVPAAAEPPPVPLPPDPHSTAAAAPSPALPPAPHAAQPPPVPDAPPAAAPKDVARPPPPAARPLPNMKAVQEAMPGTAAPTAPTPPAETPPPAVRLGDEGEGGQTDEVLGARTAPPSLDGSARNIPPRYPRAAVLRQEEGQVLLLLHLSAAGAVVAADIARSSGYPSLDDAAQAAVLGWHFKPALQDGLPVESTLPYGITFELAGKGDSRR